MCTVLFIPNGENPNFVSLRDESPQRMHAIEPKVYKNNGVNYLAPMDPLAGGTWIGVNEHKQIIILLNGGFENHTRKTSYRKSRGLIVNELLTSILPIIDWELSDLTDIEPFSLIVWSYNNLFQLVWDGLLKHKKRHDISKAHIWSSSTLYDTEAKENRSSKFQNWIVMNPPINKLSVLNFFKGYEDYTNGFLIRRSNTMQTLSYSFLTIEDAGIKYDYYDLLKFKHYESKLELTNNTCPIP